MHVVTAQAWILMREGKISAQTFQLMGPREMPNAKANMFTIRTAVMPYAFDMLDEDGDEMV